MKSLLSLDARPDRLDLRDRPYSPRLENLPHLFPSEDVVRQAIDLYVSSGLILDQGEEGACTGFGLACVINYLHFKNELESSVGSDVERASAYMLYDLARFYDEWPGESYEGSSCRGAMKAWHKHGVCSEDLWKKRQGRHKRPKEGWDEDAAKRPLGVYYRINHQSIVDMQSAIYEVGAVYVSAQVHSGWDFPLPKGKKKRQVPEPSHQTLPVIQKQKGETSGHAFAIVGYNQKGFIVQNSWGESWGLSGFAILPYQDWVRNGMDAWVAVLGAPMEGKRSSRVFKSSRSDYAESTPSDRAEFFGLFRKKEKKVQRTGPTAPWDDEQAYHHTVVQGNNGEVINRLVTCTDGEDAVEYILGEKCREHLLASSQAPKIMIYAHGGLNSEKDSLKRIRTLGPYFHANDIFPIFVTWKTGSWESIVGALKDKTHSLFGRSEGIGEWFSNIGDKVVEKYDRSIEVICEHAGVKAIWSEMKQNADASARAGRAGRLIVTEIARLRKKIPKLEVHLVGHSAGSIILGGWLPLLTRAKIPVKSCTLYAPACTIDFANQHYKPFVEKGGMSGKNFHIHLLSDPRELDDTVGPYRKSLLYLVSRALEDEHKTPLLGLELAFRKLTNPHQVWNRSTTKGVDRWQRFWREAGAHLHVLDDEFILEAKESPLKAAHGSFDNDIKVISETIERILQKRPRHRITDLRY